MKLLEAIATAPKNTIFTPEAQKACEYVLRNSGVMRKLFNHVQAAKGGDPVIPSSIIEELANDVEARMQGENDINKAIVLASLFFTITQVSRDWVARQNEVKVHIIDISEMMK